MGIFEVAGNEGPEAFLASGIPQLQTVVLCFVDHIFSEEVDADCGLARGLATLAVSSNLSWIYFSIMLDLPTDWPPRNTTLILVLPVTVLLTEWFIIQKLSHYITKQ